MKNIGVENDIPCKHNQKKKVILISSRTDFRVRKLSEIKKEALGAWVGSVG